MKGQNTDVVTFTLKTSSSGSMRFDGTAVDINCQVRRTLYSSAHNHQGVRILGRGEATGILYCRLTPGL